MVSLRERKKQQTRRQLADIAVRMFTDDGFETVTLDRVADAAEVSKRTLLRYFPTKEDLALSAESELWNAYLAAFAAAGLGRESAVMDTLRVTMIAAIDHRDADWERRFVATRRLVVHHIAVRHHSDTLSLSAQERLVATLESRTGVDRHADLRIRLLPELAMAAWRCGAKNWVRAQRHSARRGIGARASLIGCVEEAFAALPTALTITGPDIVGAPVDLPASSRTQS